MGPKTFQRVVDHIFPIRQSYRRINDFVVVRERLDFDYPDYGGLTKKVVNQLSPEAVDALQDILWGEYKNKRSFASAYRKKLLELGEKLR